MTTPLRLITVELPGGRVTVVRVILLHPVRPEEILRAARAAALRGLLVVRVG